MCALPVILSQPTFQFPPAPHLVAPDHQDLDGLGGDFRRQLGCSKTTQQDDCQVCFNQQTIPLKNVLIYTIGKINSDSERDGRLCNLSINFIFTDFWWQTNGLAHLQIEITRKVIENLTSKSSNPVKFPSSGFVLFLFIAVLRKSRAHEVQDYKIF